jgi:hypothetical protein
MSKLAVIHISDIHISEKANKCLAQIDQIASSCFDSARSADACLIAISGDLTWSGKKTEFNIAHSGLLEILKNRIEVETGHDVYVAIAPGNHDCELIPKDSVRDTLISAVVENPDKAEDEKIVDLCTSAQKEFFEYLKNVAHPQPQYHTKLFWQQEFAVGGKTVQVSSLNAAWMSRLEESQGQLVFPVTKFETQLASKACLHLALLHHPLNWYGQGSYQHLKKRLRLSCTAILTGHEHIENSGKIEEQLSGTSLFFESAALQPHEVNAVPGFSIHVFNLDEKTVATKDYELTLEGVQSVSSPRELSWTDDALIHGALDVKEDFLAKLNDAGGNFSHSSKEKLQLDDIFVWPDIKDLRIDDVNKQKTRSSKELLSQLCEGDSVILYGDDKSGKTTLTYWLFKELVSKGYAPIYLNANELNAKDSKDLSKKIEKSIEGIYKNPAAVKQFPREKRIVFIDDIDRFKSGANFLSVLLQEVERHFSGVLLTAAAGFEVANLTSNEAIGALSSYCSVELTKFGMKLRHSLIKKWCSITPVTSKPELDKRIDDVESIVNVVIGKQLIPEHPIFLLILLQSSEQHRHGELQNSGLSYYYQYLITKSLGEVGVKPAELDEYLNYLSILAWFFKEKNARELEPIELQVAHADFTSRFISVDMGERLAQLTKARILSKRGDNYSFAYPYVYYFFVGRYLAKNLEKPHIRAWVEDSCRKLYLRERANAIMFLTHHSSSSWVFDLICEVLRNCFADKLPVELNGETAYLNGLVEKSAQLVLPHFDVEKNQTEVREYQDTMNDVVADDSTSEVEVLDFVSKWNLLHKTAEILGLILKNYYGSLEREQKHAMIREVFDGPLRALRIWLETVSENLPAVVAELSRMQICKNPKLAQLEVEQKVRRDLFNLMGMVATGVVASSANFIATDKLKEDIAHVVDAHPTNAYKLIQVATRLLKPGTLPLDQIKSLANELEKNPYAFGVLQSLGYIHMYMFHTDEVQKQALSHALKISFQAAKAIEVQKSVRMLK